MKSKPYGAKELRTEVERLRAQVEELSARPDWTAYNAKLDEVERLRAIADRGHEPDGVSTAIHWFDPASTDDPGCSLCRVLRAALAKEKE